MVLIKLLNASIVKAVWTREQMTSRPKSTSRPCFSGLEWCNCSYSSCRKRRVHYPPTAVCLPGGHVYDRFEIASTIHLVLMSLRAGFAVRILCECVVHIPPSSQERGGAMVISPESIVDVVQEKT